MHLLVEHRIGAQRQLGHRPHAARGRRERIAGIIARLLVEHLQQRNAARGAAIDEGLHVAQEPRQLLVPEVGPPAEGFLHVDHDQSLLHGLRASAGQSATALPALRQTHTGQKRTRASGVYPGAGTWAYTTARSASLRENNDSLGGV